MNKVLRRNIKKYLKTLPSVSQLMRDARKGEAKRGWYRRATRFLKDYAGNDLTLFTSLLAATSPRQTVKLNLEMTIRIYAEYIGGNDDIDDLAKMSDLPAREGNVKRAFENKPLSGFKVESFRKNLLGDLKAVTLDTWMLTYIGVSNKNIIVCKGGYMAYSHRIKKAAKRLGWKPAEVQECIWSYTYAQVNKCDIKDVPEFNKEV